MSKLVSPIQVKLIAGVGAHHQLEIDLLGEDRRMLGRVLTSPLEGDPDGDLVSLKIPFEIGAAAGETGYIQVSTKDDRGRVEWLRTVPVLLLSSGENQVNPPGDTVYERIAFVDLPPDSSCRGRCSDGQRRHVAVWSAANRSGSGHGGRQDCELAGRGSLGRELAAVQHNASF